MMGQLQNLAANQLTEWGVDTKYHRFRWPLSLTDMFEASYPLYLLQLFAMVSYVPSARESQHYYSSPSQRFTLPLENSVLISRGKDRSHGEGQDFFFQLFKNFICSADI
jgi:hypothetical protein